MSPVSRLSTQIDLVVVFQEPLAQMRADEPRPAGDQYSCHLPPRPPTPAPSRKRHARPADREVGKAELAHRVRLLEIPAVENDRLLEKTLHAVEVRPAKLVPLGHDQQRIGAVDRLVVLAMVADPVAEHLAGDFHRLGVVRLDLTTRRQEVFDQADRRRLAHVVGARLEGQTPQTERAALERPVVELLHLVEQPALLPVVHVVDRR